ncbi:MAG: asparagine synthase (glutamine-hydrolyzing) [Solirubrobacterales bacterium]
MCGLAGFLDHRCSLDAASGAALARRMADTLTSRGPDDGGTWVDAERGIALAHRRLSIVDLSPLGHQPMASSCGRFVVAFNGEIYNHHDLRRELQAAGRSFRGHSDTEVILEGAAVWGVAEMARRLWGMFAIALWDRENHTLTLIRDRLGIKPLYWGQFGPLTIFGSEMKALKAHDGWRPQLSRPALAAYARFGYVPTPLGIWQGINKLAPGRMVTIGAGGRVEEATFWSAEDAVHAGIAARSREAMSDGEAIDRLETLLKDSIARHMVADVPLGAFLSGGYDSTTVVALMQAQSARPVKTFSIGFAEAGYNEAEHAKAVAAHLGTEHTELYVDPGHALDIVPRLPMFYDEPFADSSQIPTFLVSEMTRRHVTVALSGDGGDELFGGYNRYRLGSALARARLPLPRPVGRAVGRLLRAVPVPLWDRLFAAVPGRFRVPQAGDKIHKMGSVMGETTTAVYRRLVSHWTEPGNLVREGVEPNGPLRDHELARRIADPLDYMQFLDLITYLPDDILTKVDRASMAVSLEARVPLLDHRVVEFAWTLPQRQKIRGGETKWLLRQVTHRHVPRSLMERPKMGFGVPVAAWLRGPLREWAETLLSKHRLASEGIFDPAPIRRAWTEHLDGVGNWQNPLWTILMFQAWLEQQG